MFRYGLTLLGQLPSSPGPCAPREALLVGSQTKTHRNLRGGLHAPGWGCLPGRAAAKAKALGVGMAPGLPHEKWIS